MHVRDDRALPVVPTAEAGVGAEDPVTIPDMITGVEVPYTDRDDWLEKRKTTIGASDIAAIVGLSPWGTPFTVWAEKIGGAEREPTEQMEWGSKLEGLILDEFEERKGLHVFHRQTLWRHRDYEWATATTDGLVFESAYIDDNDHAIAVVEAKSEGMFGKWDEVPDHYQIQVQWQMAVTGLPNAFFAVLHGRRFETYEVEADPGVQNMLIERGHEFRVAHMLGEAPPPDVDAHAYTSKVIGDLWKVEEGATTEVDADVVAAWDAIPELEAAKKELQAEIDKRKNAMRVAMAEAEVATVGGVPVATNKEQHRKSHVVSEATFRVLRRVKRKEKK